MPNDHQQPAYPTHHAECVVPAGIKLVDLDEYRTEAAIYEKQQIDTIDNCQSSINETLLLVRQRLRSKEPLSALEERALYDYQLACAQATEQLRESQNALMRTIIANGGKPNALGHRKARNSARSEHRSEHRHG